MRKLLPYGYKAHNGVVLSDYAIDSYNRIQERINSFIESGLPVPEYLINGSHNVFHSACGSLA
jgi:hypothetical protein